MPGVPDIRNRASRSARFTAAALIAGALALSCCAPSPNFNTLASGGSFAPEDCAASPISGLPFQACMVSPWLMGSGHASSGGFSAYPTGIRPGMEGGLLNSEQIHAATYSDPAATITVQYAIPRTGLDSFYETTPLNAASLVGVTCHNILDQPCGTGSPVADLRVREIDVNGRSVRLEEFAILNNPNFRSGFVAYVRGERNPARPGYRTSMVVRGFLARPAGSADAAITSYVMPLRFQNFALAS